MSQSEGVSLPAAELSQQGPSQFDTILSEWGANWRTGLAAFIGMGLGTSVTPTVFSIFVMPLQATFGWSRGEIALANLASILSGIAAPFAGRLIDRVGTRGPLLASIIIVVLGWAALASMTGGIWQFYLFFAALSVGGLVTTGLGYSRVICATFTGSRGFSLAIGRCGLSLMSAVLPVALYAIISAYGWRWAYLSLAALALFVSLPVAWLWIERNPRRPVTGAGARLAPRTGSSSGTGTGTRAAPRAEASSAPISQTQTHTPSRTDAAALSSSAKWLSLIANRTVVTIAAAAALAYAPLLAIMSQAQPLLVGKGLGGESASALVGMLGIASLVGAFITGLLLDRLWAPGVAFVMLMGGTAGALLLGYGPSNPACLITAMLLIGLTMGAEIDLVAFVIARFCGVEAYGSVFGISVMTIAFSSAGGSAAIGFIYDATGSYSPALALCALAFTVSAFLYLSMGRYPASHAD